MAKDFLHNYKEFPNLLKIISEEIGIFPYLIEKDYWLMHVLYGLQKQGIEFELKGGTSLSKGFKIINRFSEDIDIYIKPPVGTNVEVNPKKIKPNHVKSRKDFYDNLLNIIKIDGIVSIERDKNFDDERYYRSGGIRLQYKSLTSKIEGVKDGVLLETGFDTVTPNHPLTISSWAFDKASKIDQIEIIDNRALAVLCYSPSYTLVEKLQTIATKYRQEKETGIKFQNLMRQYYDVYSLLGIPEVREFIGTDEYKKHKEIRFPKKDLEIPVNENEAFLLSDKELRNSFAKRYQATASLYYNGQPEFKTLLERIHANLDFL